VSEIAINQSKGRYKKQIYRSRLELFW